MNNAQTELDAELLPKINTLLPRWLKGGTLNGSEYTCVLFKGDIADFITVNLNTAEWTSSITAKSGQGLVSLYAFLENIQTDEALDQLIIQHPPTQINMVQQTAVMVPDPESVSVSDTKLSIWDSLGLQMSGSSQPVPCNHNILKCFQRLPRFDQFAYYDEFYDTIYTMFDSPSPKPLNDVTILKILDYLQEHVGLCRFSKEHVASALKIYCDDRRRNYVKDWLDSLSWDETPRLHSFFYDVFGTPQDRYSCKAAVNFFIAMAARVYQPGCKHDHMVYLHGKQGIGKSQAWEILGGPLYTSIGYNLTHQDFALGLRGYLIVELSELTAVKKSDVNTIKEIISKRRDDYRLRYEVHSGEHPRRCVFVGSTNDDLQLQDNTGARRFWPIYCANQAVNLAYIRANRNQLFAEAVQHFKDGESWWEMPDSETKAVQARLRSEDIWENQIERFLDGQSTVTTDQIWMDCLGQDIGKASQVDKNRIAAIMKLFGYQNKVVRSNGKLARLWVNELQSNDLLQ